MTDLVLSLFPGIGLLDRAFEAEGFCVVRGPDLLWGGDIRLFHPPRERFEGVIGGPPCQRFSRLAALIEHNGYELAEDLIPEFVRVVSEAAPQWFLMENVPAAPIPVVAGYQTVSHLLNNRTHAGGTQHRERRFTFGTRDGRALALDWWCPPVPLDYSPAVLASATKWVPVAIGGSGKPKRRGKIAQKPCKEHLADAIRAQGLPDDFELPGFTLREAVRAVGNGVPLPLGRTIARAVARSRTEGAA